MQDYPGSVPQQCPGVTGRSLRVKGEAAGMVLLPVVEGVRIVLGSIRDSSEALHDGGKDACRLFAHTPVIWVRQRR